MRNTILLIILSVLLTSCVAAHYPLRENDTALKSINTQQFKNLTVGVQHVKKMESWDHNDIDSYFKYSENQRLVRDNERLLKALKSTQLFKRVDYEDKLHDHPDISITATRGPRGKGGNTDAVFATGLSLGLLPMYETLESGIYFKIIDREDLEFRCDWPIDTVLGWISFAYLPSEKWTWKGNREDFVNHLTVSIAQQFPSLLESTNAQPKNSQAPVKRGKID